MNKAKVIHIWPEVEINQEYDGDSGYGGVSGSTEFWALFSDNKIRYWSSSKEKWIESKIPAEIEIEDQPK